MMLILCTDVIYIIIIALDEADEYVKLNSVCRFFHSIIKNNGFTNWEKFINPKCSDAKLKRRLLPAKIFFRLTTPLKDYHSSMGFLAVGYLHHKFARHILRVEFNKISPIINDIFSNYFSGDKQIWIKLQYLVYCNNSTSKELILTSSKITPYLLHISEILTFVSNNLIILKELFQIHKQRVYNIHYSHNTLQNELKRIDRRFNYVTKLIGKGQEYFIQTI